MSCRRHRVQPRDVPRFHPLPSSHPAPWANLLHLGRRLHRINSLSQKKKVRRDAHSRKPCRVARRSPRSCKPRPKLRQRAQKRRYRLRRPERSHSSKSREDPVRQHRFHRPRPVCPRLLHALPWADPKLLRFRRVRRFPTLALCRPMDLRGPRLRPLPQAKARAASLHLPR